MVFLDFSHHSFTLSCDMLVIIELTMLTLLELPLLLILAVPPSTNTMAVSTADLPLPFSPVRKLSLWFGEKLYFYIKH